MLILAQNSTDGVGGPGLHVENCCSCFTFSFRIYPLRNARLPARRTSSAAAIFTVNLYSNNPISCLVTQRRRVERGQYQSQCQLLSHVRLLATPETAAREAPLSMGTSRQEYWTEWPFPPPGDRPDPGIEPTSPALAGEFFTSESPGKPREYQYLKWISLGFRA